MEDPFDLDFIAFQTGDSMLGKWIIAVNLLRERLILARNTLGVNEIQIRVNLPNGVSYQNVGETI